MMKNQKIKIVTMLRMKLLVLALSFVGMRGLSPAQWKGSFAPPYLANEIARLAKDCYYFKEFLLINQNKKQYVLACFLNREAMSGPAPYPQLAKPVSPCGPRMQQLRLYRLINGKKAELRDSVLLDKASIYFGNAADFDNSGSTKIIINQRCAVGQGQAAPLLCYAFSIYGITKQEKLRNALPMGNLPERYRNGQPQGYALEPVVTDNFDKSHIPECLAIDDFWEGDLAFRADDFPKVTLVYVWDSVSQSYRNGSAKFVQRFTLPASIDTISSEISLLTFIENVMSIAAIGKHEAALTYINNGMTQENIGRWRTANELQQKHIDADGLRAALLKCIARYKTNR